MIVCLCLGGCKDKDDTPEIIDYGLSPRPMARKTVMLYVAAENSLSGFFNYDLREIKSACGQIPQDCRLVIYRDDASTPCIMEANSMQNVYVVEELPERNSADSAVFASTLQRMMYLFPAESYSLVLWSHGSGWIPAKKSPARTFAIDNNQNSGDLNTGDKMEIPTLRGALESVGAHYDWILFDACFMQCVEVAYELRHTADYIISSPAEIPGMGAPYDKIMPFMFQNDARESAFGVTQTYFDAYNSQPLGVVLSTVDCKEMNQLAFTTAKFVPSAWADRRELQTDGLQKYCPWLQQTGWTPEYFDMASAMNRALNMGDYEEWSQQMKRAVPLRLASRTWETIFYFQPEITDRDHLACMSMYVPLEKYNSIYKSGFHNFQWYDDAGWSETGW